MRIEFHIRTESGFGRIATTYKAENINYSETLFDKGEFSFDIPLDAKYTELISEDVIVYINDEFWGVVLYTEKTANDSGAMLSASGIDLKTYTLKKRRVIPSDYITTDGSAGYDTASGSTEAVIKHFWANNITSPANAARQLSNVVIAANQNRGISDDKYMARGNPLDELTQELCKAASLGYKAVISDGNVMLDVYDGVDRTASQSENPRAIFEISRKNVVTLNHTVDKRNYKNTFYTVQSGAEFEDEALTMTYYRDNAEASGWARDETWIEVSADTPEVGQEYAELKYQAVKAMADYIKQESFSCEITPNGRYKELWNVGDTVTVRWLEQGITLDTQVTAVATSANGDELKRIAKFGNSKPKYIGVGDSIIKI